MIRRHSKSVARLDRAQLRYHECSQPRQAATASSSRAVPLSRSSAVHLDNLILDVLLDPFLLGKRLVRDGVISIDVFGAINPQPSKLGYRRETGHGRTVLLLGFGFAIPEALRQASVRRSSGRSISVLPPRGYASSRSHALVDGRFRLSVREPEGEIVRRGPGRAWRGLQLLPMGA